MEPHGNGIGREAVSEDDRSGFATVCPPPLRTRARPVPFAYAGAPRARYSSRHPTAIPTKTEN